MDDNQGYPPGKPQGKVKLWGTKHVKIEIYGNYMETIWENIGHIWEHLPKNGHMENYMETNDLLAVNKQVFCNFQNPSSLGDEG